MIAKKPTDEQNEILSAFQSGESLNVHALAGTGKTHTLTWLAEKTSKEGLYLVYNRRAKDEAEEKMPGNVTARTMHGVAFRWAKSRYYDFKLVSQPAYKHFLSEVEIPPIPEQLAKMFSEVGEGGDIRRYIGRGVLGAIKIFCQSGDDAIQAEHFRQLNIDFPADPQYKNILRENEEFFLDLAEQVWEKMQNPRGAIPLGYDGYLKLWSLSNPKLHYGFLLVDEAQDLKNSVMRKILDSYSGQKIIVGDGQQQMYSWRGAINAMEDKFNARDLDLTKTFRFGKAPAELANSVLRCLGVEKQIIPATDHDTKVVAVGETDTAANAYLFRGNLPLVKEALSLFRQGKKYHIVDQHRYIFKVVNDYFNLVAGDWGESPIFMWYESWEDAVDDSSGTMKDTRLEEWVGFLGNNDPQEVLNCIDAAQEEPGSAYPSLSTVHKAKGLEWDTVQLGDDLFFGRKNENKKKAGENKSEEEKQAGEEALKEELRILYVALTRAKKTLILPENLLKFCQSLPKQ